MTQIMSKKIIKDPNKGAELFIQDCHHKRCINSDKIRGPLQNKVTQNKGPPTVVFFNSNDYYYGLSFPN